MAKPEPKKYEALKGVGISGKFFRKGQQFEAALPPAIEQEGIYRQLYRIVPAEVVVKKEAPEPEKKKDKK